MRGRHPSRRRLLLVLATIVVLLGAGVGVFLLLRPVEGRERRERAMQAGRALQEGRFDEARILLSGLVEEDPGNAGLRHNLAVALVRLEQPVAAEAVVRETIRRDPDHLPSHALLSEMARANGRMAEAIREARIASDLSAGDAPSRYRLAELLLDAGRTTEALAVLTEAAAREDADEGLTVRLASLLERMDPGRAVAVRARRHLDAIIAREREDLFNGARGPDEVLRFAELALRAARPQDALDALTSIPVTRKPTRAEKLLLARACAATGRHRRAMEILDELGVEPDPEDATRPGVALARATVYLQSDEPGRALDALGSALAAYPRDSRLLLLRLLALHRQHLVHGKSLVDAAALEAAATEVLLLHPDEERALEIRAAARFDQGAMKGALADATALRRLTGDSPRAAWLAGLALVGLGRESAAVPMLREGLAAAPEPASAAATLLRASLRAGDADGIRIATSLLTEDYPALRAAAAMATGDEDGANALAATPQFASEPLVDVALAAHVFAAHGRRQMARRLTATIDPDASGPELLVRADLLVAIDDRESALETLRALAASGSPDAPAALSRLAELLRPNDATEAIERESVITRLAAIPGAEDAASIYRARGELATGSPGRARAVADAILERSPDDPSALEVSLVALLAEDAPTEEIVRTAEALLAVVPAHPTARLVKARSLLAAVREGRFGTAPDRNARALDEAVSLAPDDVGARLTRGIVQANLGDLRTAEEDAEALIASDEAPGRGEFLLGIVRYQQSRLRESAEQFRLAARASPDGHKALVALGQVHLALREPEEALAVANEVEGRAGPEAALALRAASYFALGRPEEAVALVSAPGFEASDPDRLLLRARVLEAAERRPDATRAWRTLVEARPDLLALRAGLIRALLREERPADALVVAEDAARETDFGHHGRLLHAMTRDATGDTDGALDAFRGIVRDAPDSSPACRLLGQALVAAGRTREGAELLRRAAVLDPREVPARHRLAMLAEAEGREEEAVALYEEILAVAPTEVLAANNLAFHLTGRAGEEERAVELARRAVARFPEEGEFRDTLARALSACGEHTEAVAEAGKAMDLAGTSPWVAIRAAEVFRDAGREERAREAAAQAERLATPAEVDEVRRLVRALLATLDDR